MKIAIGLLSAGLMLVGCAHHSGDNSPLAIPRQQSKAVVKADLRTAGQVVLVNAQARFVVISFPPGPLPQPDHRLYVYRNGLKVGEVKVTGPQHENDTVADVITGDAQLHDEVREE